MPSEPLVSCLMPTLDRRPFVPRAIEYFMRQDYPERELVIVDDGDDPVADLVPDDPRIRYLRHERRLRLGAKRNLACSEARGEILVHWDDDDWHAPWRLSYQVRALRERGVELCGLDRLFFYDPARDRAWQYVYGSGSLRWLAGGTLCYTRSFWRRRPFPNVTIGEDNRFVRAARASEMAALENDAFYVALIHPRNTSRKRPGGRRWRRFPSDRVRALLADDHALYAPPGAAAGGDAGAPPGERSRVPDAPAGDDRPLVSCIMPTYDRRTFVPDAIRYFLRQDYPNRELLILDDGTDPIADLVPEDPRIRYLRLESRHSLGAKRNLGCEAAAGEIIAYWDDDDWYAPHRLSYQVGPILEDRADFTVLGDTLFYRAADRRFWACTPRLQTRMFHEGMVGGTQVFRKKLWQDGPRYPDRSLAEEIVFVKALRRRGARIEKLPNEGTFLYVRHRTNSWRFKTGEFLDRRGWRQVERPAFLPDGDLEPPAVPAARPRTERGDGESSNASLVSCVMATGDRPGFLSQAIKYFQRQTYDNKELIIVDDGDCSSADLVPDDDRIRYLRLEARTHLGKKLNLGIESAAGPIIQKLDDDDYYHPEFLATMVAALLPHRETGAIAGLNCFLVLLAETGELKFSGNGWCAGPSICFFRELWRKKPFRDLPRAVDYWFLEDHRVPRVKVANPELLILIRHGGDHLWKKMGNKSVESVFRRHASFVKPLAECVPAEDLDFYRGLRRKDRAEPPALAGRGGVFARAREEAFPPVSACLLSWKRPQNMQSIVDSLTRHGFIDEILVWNNDPEARLDLAGDKVEVIESSENTLCYGRFLCAQRARNPFIYVQDDDVVIHNVDELYRRFLADDSRITHGLRKRHFRLRERYHYPESHVALLGWGAFFKKEWLHVFDAVLHAGDDDYLFRREADQFFSILLGREHQTLKARATGIFNEDAKDIALYREDRHQQLRSLAVRRARALLRESKSVAYPVPWNVVITCRDYGRYLREAVDSVLHSDVDYLVTIVDDGSRDETGAIARELAREHPQISLIRHAETRGVGRSRNVGAAAVESLYLVFLDADDKIGPDYLYAAERLLRSGYDLANPDAILFGAESDRWRVPETMTLQKLLRHNTIHCCSAFRRSYWAEVGGVDENREWEDYDFWVRVVRAGARVRRLDGDHFFYRRHEGSKSGWDDELCARLQADIRQRYGGRNRFTA